MPCQHSAADNPTPRSTSPSHATLIMLPQQDLSEGIEVPGQYHHNMHVPTACRRERIAPVRNDRLPNCSVELVYATLRSACGPIPAPDWWGNREPFPIAVGSVLVQRTRWTNAESALKQIGNHGLLSPGRLSECPPEYLEKIIYGAGTYRRKASTLIALSRLIENRLGGNTSSLRELGTDQARKLLMMVSGIGSETADTILLYAADIPLFVVDESARRLFRRLALFRRNTSDSQIRDQTQAALDGSLEKLKEFHALVVSACQRFCRRTRTACAACPLLQSCATARTSQPS